MDRVYGKVAQAHTDDNTFCRATTAASTVPGGIRQNDSVLVAGAAPVSGAERAAERGEALALGGLEQPPVEGGEQ